jgi:hypothetical protein
MVKIGERLVVQSMPYPAFVESVEYDPSTGVTVIHLDWKEHGKSRVYLHDENNTWFKYTSNN